MRAKEIIISFVALLFSVIPPLIATLTYFPVWAEKSGSHVISGFALLILLVCISPIFRMIRKAFSSPSVTVIWLILFILFFILSKIAEEMIVISFVGFVGNLVGMVLFRIAKGGRATNEKETQ